MPCAKLNCNEIPCIEPKRLDNPALANWIAALLSDALLRHSFPCRALRRHAMHFLEPKTTRTTLREGLAALLFLALTCVALLFDSLQCAARESKTTREGDCCQSPTRVALNCTASRCHYMKCICNALRMSQKRLGRATAANRLPALLCCALRLDSMPSRFLPLLALRLDSMLCHEPCDSNKPLVRMACPRCSARVRSVPHDSTAFACEPPRRVACRPANTLSRGGPVCHRGLCRWWIRPAFGVRRLPLVLG